MRAFHGDPAIRETYLARVHAHAAADEIVHGIYWERGKGCAVGCTIHSGRHSNYETELGIPQMLARLEDRLFEGMANGKSKEFPARFLEAIPVGADLSRVGWQFLYWLLTEELTSRDDPRVAKQIKACAGVLVPLTKGLPADREAALKARADAGAAAYAVAAADAAAAAAAYAAADADAAAYAYAAAAAYAVAVADAAAAAAAAAAYAAATADARQTCYERMAEKLLELMAAAPLVPFFARAA
jgi:hypothetical protein